MYTAKGFLYSNQKNQTKKNYPKLPVQDKRKLNRCRRTERSKELSEQFLFLLTPYNGETSPQLGESKLSFFMLSQFTILPSKGIKRLRKSSTGNFYMLLT